MVDDDRVDRIIEELDSDLDVFKDRVVFVVLALLAMIPAVFLFLWVMQVMA